MNKKIKQYISNALHSIRTIKRRTKRYYINHIIKNELDTEEVKKAQVVLYMSGDLSNHYQFQQWVEPLKALHAKHPILVITRNANLFIVLKKEGAFPTVLLPTLNELITFYKQYRFPVILYVNNANKNFQSLIYNEGFHIHLNHGESEKESMHSNQSKAYDAVFCVGDRAIQRYEEALFNFTSEKYIKIGRPQLDFIEPFQLEKNTEQKVILYAPTWEGHHESMDYCSVAKYGVTLIQKLLEDPSYMVLYKPHGNIGKRREEIQSAHNKILSLIDKHPNGKLVAEFDINSIFTAVDFAFFDNSSVMIDYLHTDKPAFFFNIQEDHGLRFLAKCFNAITDEDIEYIIHMMKKHLATDPNKQIRKEIKTFYLGTFKPMESTQRFIEQVGHFIAKRGA